MNMLNQVVNFTVGLSSVLELPGKILSIIAVPFAIVAYLSGRRRRLIDLSGESANEELLTEVRQGFQTLAAAIAALSAGQVLAQPGAGTPQAAPDAATSSKTAAPVLEPTPARPPSAIPSMLTLPLTLPSLAVTSRPRVRYPALAIVSALGLVMTLFWVGSYIVYARYTSAHRTDAQLFADPAYGLFNVLAFLGLLVTAIALVWACVRAIRIRQPRWAVGLLLGTLALAAFTLLTMPGLLILIFAVWGPGRPVTRPAASPAAPAPALVGVAGARDADRS